MEIFSHINELGEQGWESLRTLVLTCPKVALWSPSAAYLESFRGKNPLLPNKEELLWYIRQGHIQFRARKWWIFNEELRKQHKWEYAKWNDSYDGELLDIWKEDQHAGRTNTTARVVAIDDEVGKDWAKSLVEHENINLKKLTEKVKKNALLVGYREKALRSNSMEEMAISLLRDAKNHADVFVKSGADRNLGTPADRNLMSVFTDSVKNMSYRPYSVISKSSNPKKLVEAIEYILETLSKAGKPAKTQEESFERMKALLASKKELSNFRDWVITADSFSQTINKEHLNEELLNDIILDIEKGIIRKKFLEYLVPRNKYEIAVFIASILLNVYYIVTGDPVSPLKISLIPLSRLWGVLQLLGWVPDDYNGVNWPFYLAEGKRNISRVRREALLRELRRYT
jgi:hypothetical protein